MDDFGERYLLKMAGFAALCVLLFFMLLVLQSHVFIESYYYAALSFTAFLALIVYQYILKRKEIIADLGHDGLDLSGPLLAIKIPYARISSAEMRDGVEIGASRGGYNTVSRLSGNFKNTEFGHYKIAVRRSVGRCIVVRRDDGRAVVFNLGTADDTTRFYDKLAGMVGN